MPAFSSASFSTSAFGETAFDFGIPLPPGSSSAGRGVIVLPGPAPKRRLLDRFKGRLVKLLQPRRKRPQESVDDIIARLEEDELDDLLLLAAVMDANEL